MSEGPADDLKLQIDLHDAQRMIRWQFEHDVRDRISDVVRYGNTVVEDAINRSTQPSISVRSGLYDTMDAWAGS